MGVLRNPDHVTIAVADAPRAIEFFDLLGFHVQHVATIDGGEPARFMGMPDMKAQHITLELVGADPHFEIQLLAFDHPPDVDPGEHPTNRRQRGTVRTVDDELMGPLDVPGMPLRLSAFPDLLELKASSLGEHNREVVCGLLGWSEQRYQGLVDRGILRHEPIS